MDYLLASLELYASPLRERISNHGYFSQGIIKLKTSQIIESFIQKSERAIPITALLEDDYLVWITTQKAETQQWLKDNEFEPKKGCMQLIPDNHGKITHVVVGLMHDKDTFALARAVSRLPAGEYELVEMPCHKNYSCIQSPLFYLAWGLEQYRFTVFKPSLTKLDKKLVIPHQKNLAVLTKLLSVTCWVRDLINMPAQDLNPAALEEVVQELANKHKALFSSIVGEDLLKAGFPAIHTVGRASVYAPRLLELYWGDPKAPQVTLIGKGVCFDTGGLDLKSSAGMLIMRKDMSGAAQVLGLAALIMETRLPIRLRVLIPAVENAVSGNAYRPGDVITTRKGLTVLVENTDAEGRLILSDAIAYAMESPPELLIDIASLTGAATVSLGYDIASFFTNDDKFSAELMDAAQYVSEFLWRMPLHPLYKDFISPETADLTNAPLLSYAGSITAALFLQEFVDVKKHPETTWVHFDTSAWNDKAKPGKPIGGEATVIRSLYEYLASRFEPKELT